MRPSIMDSYVRGEYTANDMLMLAARGINGETRSFGGCEIADDGTRKTRRIRTSPPPLSCFDRGSLRSPV